MIILAYVKIKLSRQTGRIIRLATSRKFCRTDKCVIVLDQARSLNSKTSDLEIKAVLPYPLSQTQSKPNLTRSLFLDNQTIISSIWQRHKSNLTHSASKITLRSSMVLLYPKVQMLLSKNLNFMQKLTITQELILRHHLDSWVKRSSRIKVPSLQRIRIIKVRR